MTLTLKVAIQAFCMTLRLMILHYHKKKRLVPTGQVIQMILPGYLLSGHLLPGHLLPGDLLPGHQLQI